MSSQWRDIETSDWADGAAGDGLSDGRRSPHLHPGVFALLVVIILGLLVSASIPGTQTQAAPGTGRPGWSVGARQSPEAAVLPGTKHGYDHFMAPVLDQRMDNGSVSGWRGQATTAQPANGLTGRALNLVWRPGT
ncbi:MAG: hypothetical protein NVS4B8_26570 [Herpetosiphon sp.]